MSMNILRYLDPTTGKYSDNVTLKVIGDLNDLLTTEKDTIVNAINSLSLGGYNGGENQTVNPEVIKKIQEVKEKLDKFFIEPMTLDQLEAFNKMVNKGVDGKVAEKVKELTDKQIETYNNNLEEAKNTLEQSISDLKIAKDNVLKDVETIRGSLEDAKQKLSQAQADYVSVKQTVDDIEGLISKKVDYAVFDLMNASMVEGSTSFEQAKQSIELMAREKRLDYSDSQVIDAIARLKVMTGLIESRVSHSQLREEIEKIETTGQNLLRHTRDFKDLWSSSNGNVQVLTDEFRNARIVKIDNSTGYLIYDLNDLKQGETYTVSVLAKADKETGTAKINFHYGGEVIELKSDQDDTVIGTEFKRYFASFVGKDSGSKQASFRFSGIANNVGYMVAPKVEKGKVAKDWQPHVDDDYLDIRSAESAIKQTSDEIILVANLLEQNGENITTSNAHIRNAADKIKLQAEKWNTAADDAKYAKGEIDVLSDQIKLKVSQSDIDKAVENITLDSKNRILNSNFSLPEFKGWVSTNPNFAIKVINDKKYAYVTEPLTKDQISLVTNYFPIKQMEKLVFGFDMITEDFSKLVDPIVSIHLHNVSNVRVAYKEFKLSELIGDTPVNNKPFRVYGSYLVDREDAVKATLRVHIKNQKNIGFTDFTVTAGDFKKVKWDASPEDSTLLVAEKFAEIEVKAGEVALKAVESTVDDVGKKLEKSSAELKVASDSIKQFIVDEYGNKQGLDLSKDGLYIDFEKVRVNGEMLAKKLTTGTLDIAQGLRITNGQVDVLKANSNGEVEMNISSLKINALPVATEKSVNDKVKTLATKEELQNIQLTPGPKGTSVQRVTNYYLAINQSSGVTRSTQGWTTDVTTQQISATKQYLWNYEQTLFDDGTSNTTTPTIIGYWGRDGANGTSGRGIKAITEYYLLTNDLTGITHSTNGWSTATKVPTQTTKYVWNYEKVEYTDNSSPTLTNPQVIAMWGEKGEKGDRGQDGIAGSPGKGIKSTTVTYGLSANETTQPSSWTTQVPSLVKGQYLWTKTVWTYTDNTNETGYVKTYIAQDGNNGSNGVAGKDGVGIKTTTITYAVSTNGTTHPTNGWQTQVPNVPNGQYLWTKTVWTYTDNTNETGYSVARMGNDGSNGLNTHVVTTNYEYATNLIEIYSKQNYQGNWRVNENIDNIQINDTVHIKIKNTDKQTNVFIVGKVLSKPSSTELRVQSISLLEGADGRDGVGINAVTEEYYLSTSKTSQTGGSWVATPPQWEKGKYIWTRSKVTYTSGSPTYTEPIVSSEWEAIDALSIGRWNLIEGGNKPITNNSYPTQYYTIPEPPTVGDTYTITIKGTLGESKHSWGVYNSDGYIHLKTLKDIGNGLYEGTFQWKNTGAGGTVDSKILRVYPFPNTVTTQSTIEWITLTKGSIGTTEWIPAISELASKNELNSISIGGQNYIDDSKFSMYNPYVREYSNTNGLLKFKIYSDDSTNKGRYIALQTTGFEPTNEEWTLSGFVKINGQIPSTMPFNNAYQRASTYGENGTFKYDNKTGYFSMTQVYPGEGKNGYSWIIHSGITSTNNDVITLDKLKFEKGNVATDWTPHYNKLQSQIDTSVSSTDVEYYLSTSTTSLSGGSWQTTAPQWVQGKYMWSRTKVTFNNGTTQYRPSENGVCIAGAKGDDGQGVTVLNTNYSYTTDEIKRYSTNNYVGNWQIVSDIQNIKTGDSVHLKINNKDKNLDVFIVGTVTGKPTGAGNALTVKSISLLEGVDGVSSYTHIAYANNSTGTSGFSFSDTNGKTYMGIYVDNNKADSAEPSKYRWTLIKGQDGANGVPGPKGADGRTPYYHTAYANSADGRTDFSISNADKKRYMGHYTDFEKTDSTDPTKYKWIDMVGTIEVGGRNYLLNSSFSKDLTNWTPNHNRYRIENGFTIIDGVIGSQTTISQNILEYVKDDSIDTIYTAVLDIEVTNYQAGKTNPFNKIYVDGTKTDNSWFGVSTIETVSFDSLNNKGLNKAILKFKIPVERSLIKVLRFYIFFRDATGTFKFRNARLLKGDMVLDWTPAPEDIQSQIENITVGSKNYVIGSAEMVIGSGSRESGTFRKSGPGTIETVTMNDIPVPGVSKAIKINGSGTGIAQNALKLTVGEWVVSYWVKGTKGDTIRIQAYWSSSNSVYGVGPNVVLDTNEWTRIFLKVKNSTEGMVDIAYAYVYSNNPLWVTAPKLEQGNILTDWSPAPEDVDSKIQNGLTDLSGTVKNNIDGLEQALRSDLANKNEVVAINTYEDFIKKYDLSQESLNANLQTVQQDIIDALARTSVIETNLGEGAADWIAKNTTIRMSEEGITIGNKADGTYVLVSSEKIAFFSGSTDEVAYVSSGMLYINQAVFVTSIQISDFIISSEKKGHLTFRYAPR